MKVCNSCRAVFKTPETIEVADHTGHLGLIIEVCPSCTSNTIDDANNYYMPLLDADDVHQLERLLVVYVDVCIQNKLRTTDATLLMHYTALIDRSTSLITEIKKTKYESKE